MGGGAQGGRSQGCMLGCSKKDQETPRNTSKYDEAYRQVP